MWDRASSAAARAYAWLIHRPAYLLLTADDPRLEAAPPQGFRNAWWGLMLLSAVVGMGLIGAWGAAWRIFRDRGLLVMPAATAAAAFVLWPFRRAVVALAEVVGGPNATARSAAAAAVTLLLGMVFLCLVPDWYRGEYVLPWWLAPLRPQAKVYRVLLLMPVWGAWAMLVTFQFCKPGERTEPALAAAARGCGPIAAAACMAAALAATIVYFHHLGTGSQVSISLAAVVSAIASGLVLCRLTGGLTRRGLLAANLTTQLAFVLAYLANR